MSVCIYMCFRMALLVVGNVSLTTRLLCWFLSKIDALHNPPEVVIRTKCAYLCVCMP